MEHPDETAAGCPTGSELGAGHQTHDVAMRLAADRFESAKDYHSALRIWMQVVDRCPGDAQALAGISNALLGSNRITAALPFVWQLLDSDRFHPPSQMRLGKSLNEANRFHEAEEVLTSVLAERPLKAGAWNDLGVAQHFAGRPGAALASFRRAVDLRPTSAAPHLNMANALMMLNRLDEAVAASQRAVVLEPQSREARFYLGCALLTQGRLREGWESYAYRPNIASLAMHPGVDLWAGEPLAGRRILIFSEQANGDVLQFCRYLPDLVDLGARVTLVVPRRLHRLLSTLASDIVLSEGVQAEETFDVQCALMDLPRHLGVIGSRRLPKTATEETPGAFPTTPYLSAEPDRIAKWRERIGEHGFRIGVAWQGGGYRGADFNRAFPLEMLRAVAEVPGVRLISLQSGHGVEQIEALPKDMTVETLGNTFDAAEDGFLDAAAVMFCVDLVITLDSALAHLAGALGRPTWIALIYAPEWRWQRERTDTPWYPTARLFRQALPADWDAVFGRMADELRASQADGGRLVPPQRQAVRRRPVVPVSWGEVFDKITILEIKRENVVAPEAARSVELELSHLLATAGDLASEGSAQAPHMDRLRVLNRTLWTIEDRLRACERESRFDRAFVDLARQVYILNDERARLKRTLNEALGSEIVEQKIHTPDAWNDAGRVEWRHEHGRS